jgi:hypothetical protein
MSSSRGQGTLEWSALVLLVALVFLFAGIFAPRTGALAIGRAVADAILCAIDGGCPNALEKAYGRQLAAIVRDSAPNLVYETGSNQAPIDYRRCRAAACSNGVAEAVSVEESHVGLPVTAFTHVVDRRPTGGSLYIQYWLYFPESFTAGIGRRLGPLSDRWPGFHPDDWEGVQVRIGPGPAVSGRATAHGHYKNRLHSDGWGRWTGWYRVSGGSHAGHLVEGPTGERTTAAPKLRLVPLESITNTDLYRFAVSPPWQKRVYSDPESESS